MNQIPKPATKPLATFLIKKLALVLVNCPVAMALHGESFISFERNPPGHKLLGVGCWSMIVSVSSVYFVFWLNRTQP